MPLKLLTTLALLALAAAGCGASSNFLGRSISDDDMESFEIQLSLGQAAYDRNNLPEALKHSEKAYKQDPSSERAAILYGFVNLSLAGGDPFTLALSILEAEAEKDKAKKEAEEAAAGAPALLEEEKEGGGTSDTLGTIKKAIGLTTEEIATMGTADLSDPGLPVLIPKCVEELRIGVERLIRLNQAIRAVCPFVDVETRVPGDYRQECEPIGKDRVRHHQAHFLWAFSHLTEALAFNSILTYATADPSGKKSNLELRVEKIKALDTSSPESLDVFLGAIKTVEATLGAIMPVGGLCSPLAPTSQLRATLNDMLAVDLAFQRIPGLPPKIANSIGKAMAKVKAGGAGPAALRGDFSKKMAKGLNEKIDALAGDPAKPLPPEQKALLCSTVGAIAAGASAAAACAAP